MFSTRIDLYKTGIDFIDKEHFSILLCLDKLLSGIKVDNKFKENCVEFNDLIKQHFINEEKYMNEIKYPFRDIHRVTHENILKKIDIYISKIMQYGKENKKYLISDIYSILTAHIVEGDFYIAEFIKKAV